MRQDDNWARKIRLIIKLGRRNIPGVTIKVEESNTIFGRKIKIILSGPDEKVAKFGAFLVRKGAYKRTKFEYTFGE
jgi:hypothetical protein